MSVKVHYTDLNSAQTIRMRKLYLRIGYAGATVFLSVYILFFVAYLLSAGDYPLETTIGLVLYWIIGLPILLWGVNYVFISDGKKALKYGILLTDKSLVVYNREIPLSTILKAEVVLFSTIFLTIGYVVSKNREKKTKTLFIRKTETDDFNELGNKIRELKGWPKQTNFHIYKWRQWKHSLKQLLEEEV